VNMCAPYALMYISKHLSIYLSLPMPDFRDSRERGAPELADHLDRAIEGHQTGLDRELGLTFAYLLAEL